MRKNIYTHPATDGCFYIKMGDRYYVSDSMGTMVNGHTPSAMIKGFVSHPGAVTQVDGTVIFPGDNVIVDQFNPTMGVYVCSKSYFKELDKAIARKGGLRVFLDSSNYGDPDPDDDVIIGHVVRYSRDSISKRITFHVKPTNDSAHQLILDNLDEALGRPKIFGQTIMRKHIIKEDHGQFVVGEITTYDRMYLRGISPAEHDLKAREYIKTMQLEKR